MAFRVYGNDGDYRDFDDEATYTFNDAGLLVVTDDEARVTYAPGAWYQVEQPLPGKRLPVIRKVVTHVPD